jgi:hypothetical protein
VLWECSIGKDPDGVVMWECSRGKDPDGAMMWECSRGKDPDGLELLKWCSRLENGSYGMRETLIE